MENKRKEIIEKSAAVFLRHGIRSVTMDDLARELSMSKKTIYNYFKDKDDLIQRIVSTLIHQNQQESECSRERSADAIEALMSISNFATRLFTEIHSSVFFDLQKYYPEAWAIVQNYRKEIIHGKISQNILRGQEEGVYLKELNPKIMAEIHLSMVTALTNGAIFNTDINKFGEVLEEIILFQLRGIVNDKGREILNKHMKNKVK